MKNKKFFGAAQKSKRLMKTKSQTISLTFFSGPFDLEYYKEKLKLAICIFMWVF